MLPAPDTLFAIALAIATAGDATGQTAFVTNQNDDTLSIIDLEGGAAPRSVPVSGQPAGVAVTPDAVFTVSPDSKTVRRFDPEARVVLAEVTLDGGPIGVVADPGRGRLFVSDWYNARIWEIDAAAMRVTRTLATGAAPAGLALSPDGRWLASADRDADAVSLFDLEAGAPRPTTVGVGVRPFGLAFAPDGRLFVANVGSNDVSVVDPVAGTTDAIVPVGERPYGIAFAAGRGFVSNQYADTVSVFDLATLAPLVPIPVGEYPEGIDATADGTRVVVANWFSNTISVIDANALAVTDEHEAGDGPRAFGRFLRD